MNIGSPATWKKQSFPFPFSNCNFKYFILNYWRMKVKNTVNMDNIVVFSNLDSGFIRHDSFMFLKQKKALIEELFHIYFWNVSSQAALLTLLSLNSASMERNVP